MSMRSVNEIVALRDNAMAMLKQRAWHGDGKGHRFAAVGVLFRPNLSSGRRIHKGIRELPQSPGQPLNVFPVV
jgi:hypothetical protein